MAMELFDHERKGGLTLAGFTKMLKGLLPSTKHGSGSAQQLWERLTAYSRVVGAVTHLLHRAEAHQLPHQSPLPGADAESEESAGNEAARASCSAGGTASSSSALEQLDSLGIEREELDAESEEGEAAA